MSKVLTEYFALVRSSDIADYGYGEVGDFLLYEAETHSTDWVITNPPFSRAEEFISRSLTVARKGVAILTRTVFLESVGRHSRLFSINPPTLVAQFADRVPMVQGRLDQHASTATSYCWLIWRTNTVRTPTQLTWIPPCRRRLERVTDYLDAQSIPSAALNSNGDLFA